MALDVNNWNQHALSNKIQTLLLLMIMASLMLLLGYLLWGIDGVFILAAMSILLFLFNPTITPKIIMQLYGAYPLTAEQAPLLDSAIKELSRRADLTHVPTLYYIPSNVLNAFSIGRPDNASIAVSDALLRSLNGEEIVGVLAHEISHIRNDDMSVMGLADMFSRVTSIMSLFGQFLLLLNLPLLLLTNVTIDWFAILLLILSPNICALAQLGLSRTREYDADLNAVRLSGDPEGLARALVKIEQADGGWLEQLFLPGRKIPQPSLLRTHPPTDERVRRLMELKSPEILFPAQIIFDRETLNRLLQAREVRKKPKWHFHGLWH